MKNNGIFHEKQWNIPLFFMQLIISYKECIVIFC